MPVAQASINVTMGDTKKRTVRQPYFLCYNTSMPNWCDNILILEGPESDIAAFEAANYDNGGLSFERAVPISATASNDAIVDERISRWGTKWDLSEDEGKPVETRSGYRLLAFGTAWGPPLEWLTTVAPQYTTLRLTLAYDEPGNNFGGYLRFTDGTLTDAEEGESRTSIKCHVCVDGDTFDSISPDEAWLPEMQDDEPGYFFCDDHQLEAEVFRVASEEE